MGNSVCGEPARLVVGEPFPWSRGEPVAPSMGVFVAEVLCDSPVAWRTREVPTVWGSTGGGVGCCMESTRICVKRDFSSTVSIGSTITVVRVGAVAGIVTLGSGGVSTMISVRSVPNRLSRLACNSSENIAFTALSSSLL